jgi:hypothetical protein
MEDAARSFESDYVHGVIAHQLGYVIIAHLAEHFYYFLYSGHAPKIINLFVFVPSPVQMIRLLVCTNSYLMS